MVWLVRLSPSPSDEPSSRRRPVSRSNHTCLAISAPGARQFTPSWITTLPSASSLRGGSRVVSTPRSATSKYQCRYASSRLTLASSGVSICSEPPTRTQPSLPSKPRSSTWPSTTLRRYMRPSCVVWKKNEPVSSFDRQVSSPSSHPSSACTIMRASTVRCLSARTVSSPPIAATWRSSTSATVAGGAATLSVSSGNSSGTLRQPARAPAPRPAASSAALRSTQGGLQRP